MTPISGFTIVRNAEKLKYPFVESVSSLLPICREFIINCGDSDDDTFGMCERLQSISPCPIKIITSKWDTEKQAGGYQLKSQTDAALKECTQPWCFYLQADEVIHEKDYPLIESALDRADRDHEIDGILFDYRHFYGNYDYLIQGRNWYRREVRLFKNFRGIQAYRDAQGFRLNGDRLKVIASQARVFHYGHVRSRESFVEKRVQMSQWWGENPKADWKRFAPKRPVGLKFFKETHPEVMGDRLKNDTNQINPMEFPRQWNKREVKNLLTLYWEKLFPFRIGEFKNYRLVPSET